MKPPAEPPPRPFIPWAAPPLTDRQKRRRIVIRGILVGLIGVVAQVGSFFRRESRDHLNPPPAG